MKSFMNNPSSRGRGFQRIAGVAATATVASQLFSAHPAFAARKKDEKAPMVDESFNAFASVYTPMLQNGGVSMVFGLAAGGALKFVGRAALVAVGIVFALMQLGAHYGFVTVNWTNLEKSVNKLMDLNGDGKFDQRDVSLGYKKVVAFLAEGVPSVGGFSAGFLLGLKLF